MVRSGEYRGSESHHLKVPCNYDSHATGLSTPTTHPTVLFHLSEVPRRHRTSHALHVGAYLNAATRAQTSARDHGPTSN
jgi:hypothetical protein